MDCFSLDNRVQKGTNDSRSIKKPSSSTRGRFFNAPAIIRPLLHPVVEGKAIHVLTAFSEQL